MKFNELKNSLSDVKQQYILSGNDSYLINHSIFLIKTACISDFPEMNFYRYDCDDSFFDLREVLATLPFGDDKRVVVLDNAVINKDMIEKITNFQFENNVIVFVMPEIKDSCLYEKIDCNTLDPITLNKWIKQFVSKFDLTIDQDAINLICTVCENKLEYIVPELEKICTYSIDRKNIDKNIVNQLVFRNDNYFTYNLTSAYENKDLKEMIKIINTLNKTMNYQNIFSSLGGYFRKMFYSAISNESDEIVAKYLNMKPYAIKKSREAIRFLGKETIIKKYQQFIDLDDKIKNGRISSNSAISSLLIM